MRLKPCPRCTSENVKLALETEVFGMEVSDFGGEDIYSLVECKDCGFRGRMQSSSYSAELSWNERRGVVNKVIAKSKKTLVITEFQ